MTMMLGQTDDPEVGSFVHPVESEMLCSLTMPAKVPYFNAPIYLENKTQIGKVDEILGPINEVFFTVKMEQGMQATSFKKDDKVYIGGDKLLPLERFLPKPPGAKSEYEAVCLLYACFQFGHGLSVCVYQALPGLCAHLVSTPWSALLQAVAGHVGRQPVRG